MRKSRLIRLEPELDARLVEWAQHLRLSVNELVVRALEGLDLDDAPPPALPGQRDRLLGNTKASAPRDVTPRFKGTQGR